MAVIVTILSLVTSGFLLFTRTTAINGFPLRHALVALAPMPLLIAWTLFRANLRPHYRSLVFQRMLAAGLVLDQQRILALNPVAEQLFQVRLDQVEEQLLSQISFPFY